ncbi:MAG TPA: hypothetical protein VF178_01195 [Gemmatimonadaceae bacterium]
MPSVSSSKSSPRPGDLETAPLTWRAAGVALVVFVLLTVLHTWPLATAPATLSRNDNGDTLLNEWTIAWVQHQVVRDPRNLFDANIFYPEKNTLAFSEHMFTQAILGLPLRVAGASPVLVFNLLLLAGFALTGWATCLVVYRVTGDWLAGVLSGTLLAFNAYALTHLPHLQSVHLEFLAPALLAFDRAVRRPGVRVALLLAAMVILQALTSNYFMVALALALVAAAAVRSGDLWANRQRAFGALLLAAAIVGVALVPFILPYIEMRQAHGLKRALDPQFSATWRDYLTTGSRLHFEWWSRQFWGVRAPLFPGFTAAILALVAVCTGAAWRHPFARMWTAVGILLCLASLGVHAPWYRWVYEHLTVFQGIRSPSRLGQFSVAAIAVLAGFGLAWVRARWRGRRWLPVFAIAVILAANVEALRAPLGYVNAVEIPPVYDVLAEPRRAVVIEFPFFAPLSFHRNSEYLLASTRHWRPLLNGYSGLVPASYVQTWQRVAGFPDNASLRALRDIGVTHVVVHYEAATPMIEPFPRIAALPAALEPIAETGAISIYHLRWERIPDWP